jgi:hypothetical protein
MGSIGNTSHFSRESIGNTNFHASPPAAGPVETVRPRVPPGVRRGRRGGVKRPFEFPAAQQIPLPQMVNRALIEAQTKPANERTYATQDDDGVDSPHRVYCHHCGNHVLTPMPLLYTLDDVMLLLPFPSKAALHQFLRRTKALLKAPRYAYGDHGRRYRILDAQEVRFIAERMRMTFHGVMKRYSRLAEV